MYYHRRCRRRTHEFSVERNFSWHYTKNTIQQRHTYTPTVCDFHNTHAIEYKHTSIGIQRLSLQAHNKAWTFFLSLVLTKTFRNFIFHVVISSCGYRTISRLCWKIRICVDNIQYKMVRVVVCVLYEHIKIMIANEKMG